MQQGLAGAHSWSYRSDNPICTRTIFLIAPSFVAFIEADYRQLWIVKRTLDYR